MRLNHVLGTTQTFVALAVVLIFVACATTKPRHEWTERALQAETAQSKGQLDVAEDAYEALLEDPPNDDKRRWLELNLGLVALERGDVGIAKRRFRDVYAEEIRDLHGANAMYEFAKLVDDPDAAVEIRRDLIRRYPNQVASEFGLQDIVSQHLANERYRDLERTLSELHPDVSGTEIGDNVLFELAKVRKERLDDPNGALEAYRELYAAYTKGPLADDALWEMAAIYRRHQMWAPAVTLLEMLADTLEASWFVGSYNSDWVDNAMFDLGWIHLVFLNDYERARFWFDRYLRKFPHGFLADDAAWHLVEAMRLAGDERHYRDALERFVRDYPESRHTRIARERLGGPS